MSNTQKKIRKSLELRQPFLQLNNNNNTFVVLTSLMHAFLICSKLIYARIDFIFFCLAIYIIILEENSTQLTCVKFLVFLF
jgi:hypothetical protein